MAYALATGRGWFGWHFSTKAKQNLPLVVYLVLEGVSGFRMRVKALLQREAKNPDNYNPEPYNFVLCESPFDITKDEQRDNLVKSILSMAEEKGIVLFIDTQAAASPALDENASKDMGQLFGCVDLLQRALSIGGRDAFVFLVAHAGKVVDPKKGARGWSGQKAPMELQLAVERTTTDIRKLTLAKSKDAADGETFSFILQSAVVAQDDDGENVVSCTVEPCESIVGDKLTPDEKKAIESLRAAYAAEGAAPGALVPNTAWVEHHASLTHTKKDVAKAKVQYLSSCLAEKKCVVVEKAKTGNRKFVRLFDAVASELMGEVDEKLTVETL